MLEPEAAMLNRLYGASQSPAELSVRRAVLHCDPRILSWRPESALLRAVAREATVVSALLGCAHGPPFLGVLGSPAEMSRSRRSGILSAAHAGQSFAFEIRDRNWFGGFFDAASPGIFTALPLSMNISRLQTGQIRRAARMISIREVIVTSERQ
jgi:hypothetical protein